MHSGEYGYVRGARVICAPALRLAGRRDLDPNSFGLSWPGDDASCCVRPRLSPWPQRSTIRPFWGVGRSLGIRQAASIVAHWYPGREDSGEKSASEAEVPSTRYWGHHIPVLRNGCVLHNGSCDESCKAKTIGHGMPTALSDVPHLMRKDQVQRRKSLV
jgi:hypothetical protein